MLTFPDGSKVGIVGLIDTMEDLYRQRKPADFKVASELMERLEDRNYFAPSERNIYRLLLLSEYQNFLEDKSKIDGK
jgi:hypothetical protein